MRALRYHPHIQGVLLVIVLFGAVVALWPYVVSAFADLGERDREKAPVPVAVMSKVASPEMPKAIELISAPAP